MTVFAVDPDITSYTYNSMEEPVAVPIPYKTKLVLKNEINLKEPKDLQVVGDKIFILDSGNMRIAVLDSNYNFVDEIKITQDGQEYVAGELTSIWIDKDNLFVVDRVGEVILRTNLKGEINKIYKAPKNDASAVEKTFMPLRLVTDKTGYLYVLLENEYRGLMVLTPEGNFVTYYGSLNTTVTAEYLTTAFLRKFMTEEQIEGTDQYIPGGYNSIDTDGSGFIYAVRGLSSDANELVCKLNPGGSNVLAYTGHFGDYINSNNTSTVFKDIAVDENGFISAIDSSGKRIFQYGPDGSMLYAFSGEGGREGLFKTPVAIEYNGADLLVIDSEVSTLTVFERENFASLIHKAVVLHNKAEFDKAASLWNEVLLYDSNYELAKIGLGKVAEAQKDYPTALSYYRDGGSKKDYSSAFYKYRIQVMRKNFTVIVFIVAAFIIAVSVFWKRSKKKPKQAKDGKISYMFHCVMHPFDGFGELRYNKRGSVLCGTVIAFIWFFVSCLNYNYDGYIFNTEYPEEFNVLIVLFSTVGIIALLVLCNWLLSTFFEGKGTFANLWIGITYSLIPMIISCILQLILSNVLTLEEAFFMSALQVIGTMATVVLVFIATTQINQYSFSKNTLVLVFTIFGILAVVFLIVLFINLCIQFIGFCSSIYNEIFYRIQIA